MMDPNKTIRDLEALKKTGPNYKEPGEIKPSPIKKPFFYDTKEGIDYFTKLSIEENPKKLTPKELADIHKLNKDMKRSALDHHIKTLKPFDSLGNETYPSRPEVRGKLLEIDKLEKDLEPPKRDHFKHYVKTGKFLEPTKEEIERTKLPSTWEVLYQGMTPFEKGQWNAQQRKKGMNGKTGDPITKTIPKEVNQVMKNELDNIRRLRRDVENLQEEKLLQMRRETERFGIIKKKEEPAGLHETFVKDKLLEGSILNQIKEDNETI